MLKIKKISGFSLVELIVAIGVFSVLAGGVTYVVTNSYNNFYGVGDKQKISEFAQEGLEIARKIKDDSWTYFKANVGSNKGVTKNASGSWEFSGSSNVSGDLTRVIYIANVSRDSQSNIVESGGTDDPMTKKVTVTVSGTGISDYVISTYLTNWGDKSWTQTDWSGGVGTEYWSSSTRAYSSSTMDGITTAGALKLQYTPGADTWGWSDITDFASSSQNTGAYASILDEASDHWYLLGSAGSPQRYTTTNIRSTGFGSPATSGSTGLYARASALNTHYPHLYIGGDKGVIKTVSTSTFATIKTYTPATNLSWLYAMAVNAAGTHMYAGGTGGILFSLDIAADGTLTCNNCTLWCDSKLPPPCAYYDTPQTFSGDVISTMYLDETNNILYLATDNTTNALMRVDVANQAALVASYAYSSSIDFTDLKYIGANPSGYNRFIVGLDYNSGGDEFIIIDDNTLTSSFTKVAGVDFNSYGNLYVRDIAYTNNNEAFVLAVDAVAAPYIHIFTISDVSTLAAPSPTVQLYDSTTYGYSTVYYHPIDYSNKYGGIFAGWTYSGASTPRTTFIEQDVVAGIGTYAASGDLVSSKFDLGSADKDLHTLTVNQDIPTDCVITITFSADDNSSFSSATTQEFTSTSATYTTAFNADMSGQRWIKYTVAMTNCNSNASTPTLYDLKLNYR